LHLLFAIGSGLGCRGEKHDPVPDLLTDSAYIATDPTDEPIACGLVGRDQGSPASLLRLVSLY
jgi:hypothetical protein